MQNMQLLSIQVEQSEKAFRVNGVTFAKKHLVNTLGKDCNGDTDKMLARYLVIVPFLAQAFDCPTTASKSVIYGAYKAKRIYKALGLTEESDAPFMLACLAMAGDAPSVDTLRTMGPMVARAFQQDSRGDNVVNFPRKPTLH